MRCNRDFTFRVGWWGGWALPAACGQPPPLGGAAAGRLVGKAPPWRRWGLEAPSGAWRLEAPSGALEVGGAKWRLGVGGAKWRLGVGGAKWRLGGWRRQVALGGWRRQVARWRLEAPSGALGVGGAECAWRLEAPRALGGWRCEWPPGRRRAAVPGRRQPPLCGGLRAAAGARRALFEWAGNSSQFSGIVFCACCFLTPLRRSCV
jgi:hypothetical protein